MLLLLMMSSCRINGFAYGALTCFGIEFITLFLGVTLFIRPLMTLNISAHVVGFILIVCLYYDVSQLANAMCFCEIMPKLSIR